ncbi:MAG: hypothetical protein HQ475_05885 [SAR202 cluster bacterium]|nr:hypothetical protein [SAR202 cluster bacterium]
MVEQGTRVDQLVSIDISERFEALQDEVDLLKNEIKQTLVDLREHMMKGRTVFSQPEAEPQRRMPPTLPPRVVYTKEPPTPEAIAQVKGMPLVRHYAMGSSHSDGMDPVMLGNIICWLGTVKKMGLSLQQVTPFLEAYEASGYLSPIMLKVLLRSLADLDQKTETPPEDEFSPEHYADCIGQLHDIICAANIMEELSLPNPELQEGYPEDYPTETYPQKDSVEAEYLDGDPPKDQASGNSFNGPGSNGSGSNGPGSNGPGSNGSNGHGSGSKEELAAERYKLTTIQVPDSHENFDFPETSSLNG